FCLLMEPQLYFSRNDTITWQKYNDLVLRNMNAFQRCLKSDEVEQSASKSWSISNLFSRQIIPSNFDQTAFYSNTLKHFTALSFQLRIRFVKAVILMNRISLVTIVF